MDKASEDYINSRNTATETEKLGKGGTEERAEQAKRQLKKIVPNTGNLTKENVQDAMEWWETHK